MRNLFILLLFAGLSFAAPRCPNYPYHDYTEATAYTAPIKPPDTLLHYCDWSLGEICILSNILNTTEDKKLFIAEFIANDSFDQITNWNQNIPFGKYPPNTSKSSKNIKDAWVSIVYLDPSVYDNSTYLINSTTLPLIRHNFTFVVDTRRLPGDCDDHFRICGYDYSIPIANTNSSISATLNVRSEYQVDRYHWVTHCNEFGCWKSCDYYKTSIFKDRLSVADSKKTKLLKFNPTSNYSTFSYYNGLLETMLYANDSNLLFNIGNSSFYKTNYLYRIRTEVEPYNVLTKEVIPANKTSAYGLSILSQNGSSFDILAPYSQNCSLKISDHFSSKTISGCNISNVTNTKPQITPVQPSFFNSLFDVILLAITIYFAYLIAKKVIPHA